MTDGSPSQNSGESRIRRVTGDGLGLQIHEWGDPGSDTVVLVHGYPDTAVVWVPVAEHLAHRFHVVAHDVRGSGASGVPEDVGGYEMDHLVGDLAAVVDAVSPDAPVHLVGHDWGSIQSWEAIRDRRLEGRVASYTSISGPPLDHLANWVRRHRLSLTALRQARRSWYVAFFAVPRLPELLWRNAIGPRFDRVLRRVEGAPTTEEWPAATVSEDGALGVNLYRANMHQRVAESEVRRTDVPVQVIVPTGDRYVSPQLLEGLEDIAPDLRRREVEGGHWIIRDEPRSVASWIEEHIRSVG